MSVFRVMFVNLDEPKTSKILFLLARSGIIVHVPFSIAVLILKRAAPNFE